MRSPCRPSRWRRQARHRLIAWNPPGSASNGLSFSSLRNISYYLSSLTAQPKRLTNFHGEIAALALGKTEKIEWTNDGFTMDGVLTYPPDFVAGRTYPLVLFIHGGPAAASIESFNTRAQLMAARGWLIFEPNYRGSDNLGSKFMRGIFNDAGAGLGRDVMAGIEVLKKRGFVDATRMAVSGWSYGGYMTTWMIGHYQIWKAAVAGAAVTDWMGQYNIGDGNVSRASQFGGSPWTGDFEKAYREQSPITAPPQIKTPTLILSDTGGVRLPRLLVCQNAATLSSNTEAAAGGRSESFDGRLCAVTS